MAEILIIGAGIIGLSSAYYLSKQGHQITVIDKGDISDNCSFGNAGMIVPSHFVPLAAPGMIRQGIRWMFDSKSPFYVKPALGGGLPAWGIRFLKKSTQRHVAESAVPLRDLSLLSRKLFEDLAKEPGFDFGLTKNGILAFYKTDKAAEEEAHLAKRAVELGLDMAVLSVAECKALQPMLKLDVLGAVHYRCDAHLYPVKLMQTLLQYLEKQGVKIVRDHEVTRIDTAGYQISAVHTGELVWKADQYVLAAGSWSPAVARMMGLNVLLMPGKGYSFMEDEPARRMTIPALLCEARVAITPMNGQIRYGGTMEIAKINSKVNMNRVKGIVESVPEYFPDLKPELPVLKDVWYGFRPSSPDGLPYIGRSAKLHNLVVAAGHGMMGLSLGPATGLLVSQIMTGQKTEIDIQAFLPSR
ncbi:NAD(P)/FAD-dependent oxidoreductase [Pedobacter metabolipauper]|uniref:D-amino-acid dehydrogenase n=1 Tax=Pedobacter metabolipauper TaxID=425513 RepID=A0A4R6ST23_9SPHI|nr:FAD-dependent oxidoreductase [Pedobacter metabolipauper]TDQ06644.1 D-amino-acid dehydrogenase [Pedobacter metabolipauper]